MLTRNEDVLLLEQLPWKQNQKSHVLHGICSRICSFPPNLVKHFILNYSQTGEVVFDPFSGKGTVPLEALLNQRIGWGNDVSPEAYILTSAKVNIPDKKILLHKLDQLKKEMGFLINIKDTNPNVKIFYSPTTLKQILELKELLKDRHDKYSMFIKAIIIGILHGSSVNSLSLKCSHSYSMSPNYVKKYAMEHRLVRPKKDVINCIKKRVEILFDEELPKQKGKSYNHDSRKLKIKSDSVDLIITSPPYFAIQTYASDNWLRLWFLGYDYKEIHKKLVNTNSKEKYGLFMYESLKEMFRVLKKNSHCFIVVGDVKKRTSGGEIIINTAEFLIEHAKKAGFMYDAMIVDKIPQTKKVLNSAICSTGISTERILCLIKPS